jgi:hypothetical protein
MVYKAPTKFDAFQALLPSRAFQALIGCFLAALFSCELLLAEVLAA